MYTAVWLVWYPANADVFPVVASVKNRLAAREICLRLQAICVGKDRLNNVYFIT